MDLPIFIRTSGYTSDQGETIEYVDQYISINEIVRIANITNTKGNNYWIIIVKNSFIPDRRAQLACYVVHQDSLQIVNQIISTSKRIPNPPGALMTRIDALTTRLNDLINELRYHPSFGIEVKKIGEEFSERLNE